MKLIYLLTFLLLAGTAGIAQKRDTVHHAAAAKKPKMKEQLGLSKKQEADVKATKTEYKDKKEKIKSDPKLSESDKKAKMKALKKEKKQKVESVLTPEQKAKAKELKKEKKAKKAAKKS